MSPVDNSLISEQLYYLIPILQVLAQASSGNAPSMPPLPTQKALTLEEIELQAATAAVRM